MKLEALEREVRHAREMMAEGGGGGACPESWGSHTGEDEEPLQDPLRNAKEALRELSAKELKHECKSKGIDCRDCVEKEDLVKRLLGLGV